MNLTRGQRVKLNNLVSSHQFSVIVNINSSLVIDYSCFGLDDKQHLSDERYMTFYNQKETPCQAVILKDSTPEGSVKFNININKLPSKIHKIVITSAIDGNGLMSDISNGSVQILEANNLVMTFPIQGQDFNQERALMLLEIYKKNNEWRVCCLGQGFNGGLAALVKHFGGQVSDSNDNQSGSNGAPPSNVNIENTAPVIYPENPPSNYAVVRDGSMCIRCHKKTGIIGKFLGYNLKTYRCGKCDTEVNKNLSDVRMKFLNEMQVQAFSSHYLQTLKSSCAVLNIDWIEVCQFLRVEFLRCLQQNFISIIKQGFLTNTDVVSLKNAGQYAHLDWQEVCSSLQEEILKFLEKTLVFYASDGIISEEEDQDFHRFCELFKKDFHLKSQYLDPLLQRIAYLKEITAIRKGVLNSISTRIHLDSDEICYMDIDAVYQKVTQRGTQPIQGKMIVTNKKINFLSEVGGWEIRWKNVMSIRQQGSGVMLELSALKGNGRYQVQDALMTEAILTTVTRIAKRQLLIPTNDDEVQTRKIQPEVKIAVWQRDQGKCVECSASSYLEFDHVIPFSKGGANTVNNIQLLCRRCNLQKSDRI